MEPARAAQALAEASSSMTRPHDVVGALGDLLQGCLSGLAVDAAGILVDAGGHLELLASSSHEAAELETHQLHVDEGPCVEAHATATSLQAHGERELRARWPQFASTMLRSGFHSVHAAPLVLQGQGIGAMGIFRRADEPFGTEEDAVAQAFADIASMLILHTNDVGSDEMSERLRRALDGRVLVEQAKGVLADQRDVEMAEAYRLLVEGARERRLDVTTWASEVIDGAQRAR
ncbi:hypothetical protein ASD11_14120 [Aeromicrobium sp. Root495]|uniref:ANTAR domain-containing protein n=1 Tax=Aeromicrobium sp. Root495 TaxID=1736550 RepID=UPI0007018A3F|nr:ANTAR domain-containing protein [Aeromicrobium sp. Root495]KQY55647.1 hypothetical protein ASD11_14120 [Aeromicrobium sp. Root495]